MRLLTLTGPGGTGKTRLALQAAAELVEDFQDGVFFVNLAPLSDPELVVPTIAQTLALKERPGETLLATLAAHLAEKQLLLLLDNFEQVAEAAPALAELVRAAASLNLLATSRAPLHLSGEREYPVPPLAGSEAVSLFAERAQAAKPAFVLDGNRPLVAEICRRLDNLPLAIELAAARVKLLPERALLERLDERLKLLTGGARDLDARQQTLRAAIDWSYQLLAAEEQTLFARLSVFAGGRTLEAIEAICNPDGELDVFEGIASLVDKSLLRREEGKAEEPRFVMLETIHEYARERLEESGEAEELTRWHAEYFDELVSREVRGSSWRPEFARFVASEESNLRTALEWALSTSEVDVAVRLCLGLSFLWYRRAMFSESVRWCDAVLALPAGDDLEARWRLLTISAEMLAMLGERERARAMLSEADPIAHQSGDPALISASLAYFGHLAVSEGDYSGACELYERATALDDDAGASAERRAIGRLNLGWALQLEEDFERAERVLAEGLDLARAAGRPMIESGIRGNLAHVGLRRGDYDTVEAEAREALRLAGDTGEYRIIEEALVLLARSAAAQGKFERGAILTGAAEAIRESGGAGFGAMVPREGLAVEARAALGGEAWDEHIEKGRALSPDDAVAYALDAHPASS